jgi:hypothetical protein
VAPVVTRWQEFAEKVCLRAQQVETEARAGLEELFELNLLDPQALSAGFSATEGRFRGLETKVREAADKLAENWEEATQDLDLESAELAALQRMESQIQRQARELQLQFENQAALIELEKQADWARRLQKAAQHEAAELRTCGQCAATLELPHRHAALSVTCRFCKTVNDVAMTPAAGLFFANGAHNLAREAAKDSWLAERRAERAFKALRHPTETVRTRYHEVAHVYWTAYYRSYRQLNPGFPHSLEEAVAAKLAHYGAYDYGAERRERSVFDEIVRYASARNQTALLERLRAGACSAEDAACAVYERGDHEGAILILRIQHALEEIDEPAAEFIAERMSELERAIER